MKPSDREKLNETINGTVEKYREKKKKLEALKYEIQILHECGNAVPGTLTDRLDRCERLLEQLNRALVRAQNDYLRVHRAGGNVMLTSGLRSLGSAFIAKTIAAIRSFDAFTKDNDPYGEHDFGAIEIEGVKIFFKIDAYDTEMRYGSPDPAYPLATSRVMTVMLAEEY